jgi:hypothetical protein
MSSVHSTSLTFWSSGVAYVYKGVADAHYIHRGAALQLTPNQPTYEIIILIYFDTERESLDPSKCSCIAVQVKNRAESTELKDVFHEAFTIIGVDKKSEAAGAKKWKAREGASIEVEK